jgi:hypothetical protein
MGTPTAIMMAKVEATERQTVSSARSIQKIHPRITLFEAAFSANRAIDDGGDHPMTRAYTQPFENAARLCRSKTAARMLFLRA